MSRFQELERSGSEAELEREETLSIPEIKQRRAVLPSDVRKVIVGEEGQQEWSPSLDQEEPPEPPHIKEEQEELWTSQEGEQLQGLEEADVTKFLFTPVPVKSEDDEEKPQSSQLHQRQTEQMETGADGEDCGGPEPARNSHPDPRLQPETEDSEDWSRKTRENQSGLKSQKNKVSKSDGKPFSCSECGKRFSLNRNIDRHMRIHTGEKPFTCSFCGQRFTQKPHMTRHMAIHTGEKPFSCSDCGKTFIRKEDMTRHMVVHTGEKRFSCSICDQRFAWPDQLRKHKCVCPQSTQLHQTEQNREAEPGATREKPFSCPDCGKRFQNKRNLTQHMLIHTGERRFSCSICGKRFTQQGHLSKHMAFHTGEKPFSCSFCGKRFTQKVHMTGHMAIHTGEKRFSCSVCDQRFTWDIQLRKHKRVCPQSSQLHQTEQNREAEPGASSSTEQMETGADGEDCGGHISKPFNIK